nr:variable surface lipoprotein [Mycoplasmopsis bovis]
MKKSKFLLLGSVASLASIPFVAAKCGETKEEKKPEAVQIQIKVHQHNPGSRYTNNPDQGTPTNPDQGTPANPDQGTPANPDQGTPANPDKVHQLTQIKVNQLNETRCRINQDKVQELNPGQWQTNLSNKVALN